MPNGRVPDAATFSSGVLTSWLTVQLKLTQTTPVSPVLPPRRFAYTAIALYESIVPGLSDYQSLVSQLNGLPALPTVMPGVRHYWPACANAALAAMNRNFYPTTSAANKASIDSLEALHNTIFLKTRMADEVNRSADFGRQIAAAVFAWSKSDGSDNATPYTPPVGPGLWVPTPPAFATAAFPNWGKCRPIVVGSDTGVDSALPISYSENPASAYYTQANEVVEIGQNLTAEQKTIALFWADSPDGKSYTSGHWLSILNQVLAIQKPTLDVAAVAFVQFGIAYSDAQISIVKSKYKYNAVRPISYIRTVMSRPTWNALLATPAHPEYPAGHAVSSGAAAQTLTLLFGGNYKFTDNSYNLIGFSPRTYNSFNEAATEAGNSRVYGGIHYQTSCDVSIVQGKTVANNVAQKLTFRK